MPDKKEIKKQFSKILENHKSAINEYREYKITDNFKIIIIPSAKKLKNQYEYGMSLDYDSVGPVVGLIYNNLKLIVAEKESKVKNYKSKYPEWWLAVVDYVGYGLVDLDAEQFYDLPKIKSQFDRILLVSPSQASNFRFLYE
ncbi:MAG: hypothetical protein RMJ33_03770 [Saprospiraceae bacterium]|nr:hypothetical protein [Saprospiraceae bacterium]